MSTASHRMRRKDVDPDDATLDGQIQYPFLNSGHDYTHTQHTPHDTSISDIGFAPSSSHFDSSSIPLTNVQSPQPHANFLTPEYSSENPYSEHSAHTTPSIEDFYWEQSFDGQSAAVPRGLENCAYSKNVDLSGLESSAHNDRLIQPQLLSPQPTTTPSPPGPIYQSTPAYTTFVNDQLMSTPNTLNTPVRNGQISQSLLTSTPTSQSRSIHDASFGAGTSSPAVFVSSYEKSELHASSLLDIPDDLTHPTNFSTTQHTSDLREYANDQPHDVGGEAQRSGWEPTERSEQFVPSLKDMEEKRDLDERNAQVQTWLSKSESGSPDLGKNDRSRRVAYRRNGLRARSTGARPAGIPILATIPGPGVLVDEDSDWSLSNDESSSLADSDTPPAVIDPNATIDEVDARPEVDPASEEPLPRQFYRKTPWQDPLRNTDFSNTADQPATSNAAMMKYDRQAAKFETASRAATWGTRRRLSESEVSAIVDGSKVRHLSLSKNKTRERGASFLNKARGLIPHRSNSNLKKKPEEAVSDIFLYEEDHGHKRGNSLSSVTTIQRKPSFGKPKAPQLKTGSAIMAMTGQLAAIGRSTSLTPHSPAHSPGSSHSFANILKRSRSKSEISKGGVKESSTAGIAELMTQHGGPPMPSLASPMQESLAVDWSHPELNAKQEVDGEDEDEDETMSDRGIKMDLKIRADNIIPTMDGFKEHAQHLNPRVELFLLDRVSQEQIRRYKKLVESKVKHTRAVLVQNRCSSGKYCVDLGGSAELLPPRASARDPDATCSQFQIGGNDDLEIEADHGLAEGQVTPAQFPPGIPLPPVARLPAEFECPLCFKVKKFQKPSDWTKHVHEDMSPFTCTFPNCPDSKSFKRKADWVRHENERHRHLEWWKCSVPECGHVCYRKDNFVQHLVREHKKAEPKYKGRVSGSSKIKTDNDDQWPPSQDQDNGEVLRLLESCHGETNSKPKDETCKFCGNVLGSWKKLTVHLAKHMEQIAMPVLDLVKIREVTPDTIISPIEKDYRLSATVTNESSAMVPEQVIPSPYSASATSLYPASPAAPSPLGTQLYSTHPALVEQGNSQPYMSNHFHAEAPFIDMNGSDHTAPFGPFQSGFTSTYQNSMGYPSPHTPLRRSVSQGHSTMPRSQPMYTNGVALQQNVGMYNTLSPAGNGLGFVPTASMPMFHSPVYDQRNYTGYGVPSENMQQGDGSGRQVYGYQ